MDDERCRVKAVKTFRNAYNKFGKIDSFKPEFDKDDAFEPLTTKDAVKFLLEGSLKYKVCRYCLNVASPLSELDEIFEVAREGAIYKVTLRDMIASVHPYKVVEDPNFPDKICQRCVESAISSYMFSQQCERGERALRNCFDDIHTKFEKLDPLERPKKRGRQKLNPNANVLYIEHKNVIDYAEPIIHIINAGSLSLQDENKITPFECPKCWQVLPDMEALLNHENIHPKSMWFNCRLCGQSFVNYRHYKRHIRDVHKDDYYKQERLMMDMCCRCNECGFISTTFGEHLQHMEKHKFRTTFEHLLDRKMNRLCGVCLEKGSRMVHMNETIQLNGGYPGINNEQAIYSIVSLSLPERKSYKYQELLIPTRANIMTITKRMESWPTRHLRTVYIDKEKFKFCNPTIVSMLNTELETHYLFFFPKPYSFSEVSTHIYNTSILNNTSIPLKPTNQSCTNEIKVQNVGEFSNMLQYNSGCNIDNIFIEDSFESHQNNSSLQIDKIVTEGEYSAKLCKVCWIFNKPSCEKCVANTLYSRQSYLITNNDYNEKGNGNDTCNYCWLFNTIGKCEHCQKILNDSKTEDIDCDYVTDTVGTSNSDDLTTEPNTVMQDSLTKDKLEDGIRMIDESIEDGFRKDNRKRKSFPDLEIKRNFKWQCRICLINNEGKRQTCYCCDFSNTIITSDVKFKFGMNKNPFVENVTMEAPKIQNITHTTNEIPNDVVRQANTNLMSEAMVNNYQNNKIQILSTENIPMDIEMINSIELQRSTVENTNQNLNQFVEDESMDVSYEDDIMKPLNQTDLATKFHSTHFNTSPEIKTLNVSQNMHMNVPFQFSIGSGTSTTKQRNRKDVRPLKRIANMGRK